MISVYATGWRWTGEPDPELPHLELGQLDEFYSLFQGQLPRVIHRSSNPTATIAFAPATGNTVQQSATACLRNPEDGRVEILSVHSWLFVLPSDQVVAALDFEVRSEFPHVNLLPMLKLLEHCAYARLIVGKSSLEEHIAALAEEVGAEEIDTDTTLPPERHQIVFIGHTESTPPDDETIKNILYRAEPPNRPEFMEYKKPSGLNQTGRTLCAVTPYVSLLYGQQTYVENSVFLTVVQAVGTAARFRQIWQTVHNRVRKFRNDDLEKRLGAQRRGDLEFLADELGNLELDLSFSVETSADPGLLIPALRIESFHKELYAAMELRERAKTASRMFIRLAASIRSELIAIDIRERQQQEERRLHWGAAITVLSLIAVPIGFLGAYFGVNAREVNNDWSIFDMSHHQLAYIAAGCLALIPFITFLALNGHAWLANRREKKQREMHLRALSDSRVRGVADGYAGGRVRSSPGHPKKRGIPVFASDRADHDPAGGPLLC
ncbi:MAG: hypothetical protein ACRDSF_21055, partial [Pseudonocardiaceae bacterium]